MMIENVSDRQYLYVVGEDRELDVELGQIETSFDCSVRRVGAVSDVADRVDSSFSGCVLIAGNPDVENTARLVDQLRQEDSAHPVIVVSRSNDVATAVHHMRAGVFDYQVAPAATPALHASLQKGFELARELLSARKTREATRERLESLTGPERDTMDLLIEGRANKVAARLLGVGLRTVERRRQMLLKKMGVEPLHQC